MTQPLQSFGGEHGRRRLWPALSHGAAHRCPRCGEGRLFLGYLKSQQACSHCGLDFSGHEADDAPPYFTIIIVGHIAIPLALAVKQVFDPPMWLQFAFWTPAIMAATFWLLPIVKGALIGLQWANAMHGFAEPIENGALAEEIDQERSELASPS